MTTGYNAVMTKKQFEERLRTLVRRCPFQPFTVLLTTGDRIEVGAPDAVAMGGGAAGCFTPDGDPVLVNCKQVRQIIASTL